MDARVKLKTLSDLEFDNRLLRDLPADPVTENHCRQVRGAVYSRVAPSPSPDPELVAVSREMLEALDLEPGVADSDEFLAVFAGNRLLPAMDPHAVCYGGHQFGNWAGQLGDGRAINLGDVINGAGQRWTLQLKGAGLTPYSRSADGLAVLRSSLREFICSEAMHHLGVPTTRALSMVLTGRQVVRDMFYDGNPEPEPGAVVCRVAPSFIRFGNFQILAAREEHELLRRLVTYTINTDFAGAADPGTDDILAWFREVCLRTARLMVHWMRVGFVHGVMNTDNMSVLGLTIDYGPYGWLEGYDPHWTPNTTDAQGRRYRFGHQPQVALWNLVQFANALYPLIGEAAPLEAALEDYQGEFQSLWQSTAAAKLGIGEFDQALVNDLFEVLSATETDYTLFFRRLAAVPAAVEFDAGRVRDHLSDAYYATDGVADQAVDAMVDWIGRYQQRLRTDGIADDDRRRSMDRVNPKYVFRNYIAQLAIDKVAEGDFTMVEELLEVFRHPYDEQPQHEKYAARRPEWARQRPGCSMLSCSS